MTEIRKNEFMDVLQMNELLFVEHEHFIQANIPKIGNVNYYPKADKLQFHKKKLDGITSNADKLTALVKYVNINENE